MCVHKGMGRETVQMQYKTNERVKALRELLGFTQEKFASYLGVPFVRYRNIEQGQCRVAEEEFATLGKNFPELLPFMTFEGPISLTALQQSENNLLRLVAAKIEAEQLPKSIDISPFIEH